MAGVLISVHFPHASPANLPAPVAGFREGTWKDPERDPVLGELANVAYVDVVRTPSAVPCPLCGGPMRQARVDAAGTCGRISRVDGTRLWLSMLPAGFMTFSCPDCAVRFTQPPGAGSPP